MISILAYFNLIGNLILKLLLYEEKYSVTQKYNYAHTFVFAPPIFFFTIRIQNNRKSNR